MVIMTIMMIIIMVMMMITIREGFKKTSRCSFGFCPNQGGEGPAQIFCPLFTNCTLGKFGDGEERGGDPCPIFWYIGIKKKWYKLSKLEEGGGRGILDKIQKNSYFFS